MRQTRTILILSLAVLAALGAGCTKDSTNNTTTNTTTNTAATPTTNEAATDRYDGQETQTVLLNFKDFQVAITGYPYIDTAYRPRIYNLIYMNTVYAYDDVANLTDPSGIWNDIYETSTEENTIFIPVGRTAGDEPVWQTMEVIPTADVETVLGPCTGTSYDLPKELTGTSYDCESTKKTKLFVGKNPCFVEIDDTRGLLYREYSSDPAATGSMCEILAKNHINAITIHE